MTFQEEKVAAFLENFESNKKKDSLISWLSAS